MLASCFVAEHVFRTYVIRTTTSNQHVTAVGFTAAPPTSNAHPRALTETAPSNSERPRSSTSRTTSDCPFKKKGTVGGIRFLGRDLGLNGFTTPCTMSRQSVQRPRGAKKPACLLVPKAAGWFSATTPRAPLGQDEIRRKALFVGTSSVVTDELPRP